MAKPTAVGMQAEQSAVFVVAMEYKIIEYFAQTSNFTCSLKSPDPTVEGNISLLMHVD